MYQAQYNTAHAFDIDGDSLVGFVHYVSTGEWVSIDFRGYADYYELVDEYYTVVDFLYDSLGDYSWDVFCGFGLYDNVSNVDFISFAGYNDLWISRNSDESTAFFVSLSNACIYTDDTGKTAECAVSFNTTEIGGYNDISQVVVRTNISVTGSVSMVTRGTMIQANEGNVIIDEGSNDIFKNSMSAITEVLQVQVWENMTLGTVVFVPVLMGLAAFFVKSFKV